MEFPLLKREFTAWLQGLGRDRLQEACGWSQSYDDCPLSRCIVDQGEYVPGAIYATHAILFRPGDRAKYEFTAPPWVQRFVTALDAGEERVVSAREALDILGMSPVAVRDATQSMKGETGASETAVGDHCETVEVNELRESRARAAAGDAL